MNRTELVDNVASATGLERRQAEAAVVAFVDAIVAETRSGGKVSVFGFGTFTPTSRAARMGRNPQTGAPVKIAASKGVRFSPAAGFKTALNAKGSTRKVAVKALAAKATSARGAAKTTAARGTTSRTAATSRATTASRVTAASRTTASRATAKAPARAVKSTAKAAKTPARAATRAPAKAATKSLVSSRTPAKAIASRTAKAVTKAPAKSVGRPRKVVAKGRSAR